MSVSINTVVIGGNVTRDPQVKFLENERCVASFGVAINETWKDKSGEKKEKAIFAEVEVWGKTAEMVGQYVHKGDPVLVEGKLSQDAWEDKETGKKQTKTKVKGDRVHFLGAKRDSNDGETKSVASKPVVTKPKPASTGGIMSHDQDQEPPFNRMDERLTF